MAIRAEIRVRTPLCVPKTSSDCDAALESPKLAGGSGCSRHQGRNFHARDLNLRPTDHAVTRSQLSPFINDETAALRRGLAFERAHFSPDPLNGGSPDADGRGRLVDARAAP